MAEQQLGSESSLGSTCLDGAEARIGRLSFFLQASNSLTSSLDYETTLQTLGRLVVSSVADCCAFYMPDEDGVLCRRAVDANDEHRLATLQAIDPTLGLRASEGFTPPALRAFENGSPERFDLDMNAVARMLHDPRQVQLISDLGARSVIAVPLQRGSRRLGVMVLTSCNRCYDDDDLAFTTDIAFQAAIAIDNALLYQQAERAVQGRDDVLAVVSHDLRNPLALILLNVERLQQRLRIEGIQSPALCKAVGVIGSAAQRMDTLIGDLMDASCIRAGQLAIKARANAPDRLVTEVVDTFDELARCRQLTLRAAPAADLPHVICDRGRILQVLSNLLDNALKVTPQGGRVVLEAVADADGVCFSVADTGPGLRSEDIPYLFERFWRSDRSQYSGSGLGLAIAKSIIDAHQGRIWAENRAGGGARFSFFLPTTNA